MIWQALQPLLRRLFWNWWRPLIAGFVLVTVVVVLLRVISGGSGGSPNVHHVAPRPTRPAAAAAPTPSSSSPAPSSQPSVSPLPATTGPAPAAAVPAADRFLTAYASQAPDRLARMQPWASPALMAQLSQINAEYNPVTSVTGQPALVSQAPQTVNLSARTDAGTVLLTVKDSAGQWKATSIALAAAGD